MTIGIVTARGPALRHAGVTVQLPATRTPLGEAVAALVAAIDAGELLPCRHCGAYGGCDCEEWVEAMERLADCAAPLDVITVEDIPF